MTAPIEIILTGGTGALGAELIATLLRSGDPVLSIAAICRPSRKAEELRELTYSAGGPRLRIVLGDIEAEDCFSPEELGPAPAAAVTIGVHCAADVSWHKSFDAMRRVNADGTRAFCLSLRRARPQAKLIYVSTAFTHPAATSFRNGYEQSKAVADALVRREFTDLDPTTFSCSLLSGTSRDGVIARFNGVYPLARVIAVHNPPAVIGNATKKLDVVPIDWVAAELTGLIRDKVAGRSVADVVASAGDGALTSGEALAILEDEIAGFRAGLGVGFVRPAAMVSTRQYKFLQRAVHTWRPSDEITRNMRRWERLQAYMVEYGRYLEHGAALPPLNVRSQTPDPKDCFVKAIRYWLDRERASLERAITRYTD